MPDFAIKWIVYGILALVIFGAGTRVGYKVEKIRADSIEAAWEKDKARRIALTTGIVLQDLQLRGKIEADLREARNHVEIRTVQVVKEIPAALGPVASIRLPDRAVQLYNFAIGARPEPARVEPGRAPNAAATETATVSDLETVCVENAAEQLIQTRQINGLIGRIDAYNAAIEKGKEQP